MNTEKKRRRGRPKADYTCAISKRVCPFNDDFWEWGAADAAAADNCPIQSYENNNRIGADGVRIIDDWCKHLIPRNSETKRNGGKVMADNHFADVGKMGTMSLNLALIVLDRLNTSERIDVARDNLVEAVRVVSAAAKYRIPQKPEKSKSYWASLNGKVCPTCKYLALHGEPKFCSHCGQALDWSDKISLKNY